jgi:hypothetical protein
MTSKPKPCDGCAQTRRIWKNHEGQRFCQACWARVQAGKGREALRRPSRPRPVSVKKKAQDFIYAQLREAFLARPGNGCCAARITAACTACRPFSLEVHHKKGRGKHYLDPETWLAVCRSCHEKITEDSRLAIALGLSLPRNT